MKEQAIRFYKIWYTMVMYPMGWAEGRNWDAGVLYEMVKAYDANDAMIQLKVGIEGDYRSRGRVEFGWIVKIEPMETT